MRYRRGRAGWSLGLVWLMVILACLLDPEEARAQFLSPGKLASPHSDLEGLKRCTSCHDLKKVGVETVRCLECHEPLRSRLANNQGYHARITDRPCGACHVEHRGSDTPLIDLDASAFDHAEAGLPLEAGHADVDCRDCHRPEFITASDVRDFKKKHGALDRTMLGLGSGCGLCHEGDDPHGDQLQGRGCAECHTAEAWDRTERFDHGQTRYRLTGRHRTTRCAECHPRTRVRSGGRSVKFAPLDFARCESCHEDEHRGTMEGACSRCHSTASWQRLDRSAVADGYDHSDAEFPLVGKHAEVECQACHAKRSTSTERISISIRPATLKFAYPRPVAENCTSCHRDYHEGVFRERPRGIACEDCHDEHGWTPLTFDVARHNSESEYRLEGAHVATPCVECHPKEGQGQRVVGFQLGDPGCEACHAEDDPHERQFEGTRCSDCHETERFSVVRFDHDRTEYPLDGAHRDVPCVSCHPEQTRPDGTRVRLFKPLKTGCRDCHSETGDG